LEGAGIHASNQTQQTSWGVIRTLANRNKGNEGGVPKLSKSLSIFWLIL